jgi:hypothetical protein
MLENSKKRLGRKCSRIGCGLAEEALDFIRKRIAEMSQEVETLESKML